MTFFLNPVYLSALILAGVPILIHLIRNRKVKVIPWAAFEFLLQARKKNRRRLRIEQLIILAIRVLIVICIVTAFCRPIIKTSGLPLIAANSRIHAILVIDNSFSMNYRKGDESELDKAKRAADAILTKVMKQGDSVQIVLAATRPDAIVAQPTFEMARAREAVRGISAGDYGTDYAAVMERVSAMLQDTKAPVKEIYWITDSQSSGFDTVSQEKLRNSWEKLTGAGRTTWVQISEFGRENMSIEPARFSRDLITPQAPVRISSVVHNDTSNAAKALLVNLVVDGRQAGSARLDVPARTSKPVSFVYLFDKPGPHNGYMEITQPDQLADDNRSVFAVNVREKLKILVIDPNPSSDAAKDEAFYLVTALAPTGASEGGAAIVQPTIVGGNDIHTINLKSYDSVVVTGVLGFNDTDKKALAEFVTNGGGLWLCPSPTSQIARLNELYKFDKLAPVAFVSVKNLPEDAALSINPATIKHPALLSFRETNDINIGAGRFNRIFDLKLDPGDTSVKVSAQFSGGQPAIVERSMGLGKVILFAAPIGAQSSSLPFKPAFVPMVHQLISYLSAGPTTRYNLELDEKMTVRFSVANASKPVRVVRPDNKTLVGKSVLTADGAIFTSDPLTHAGIYKVGVEGSPYSAMFAVNRPMQESNLLTLDESSLRNKLGAGKFQYANGISSLLQKVTEARKGAEIWRGLIILAVTLLCIEALLAWKFGRRS